MWQRTCSQRLASTAVVLAALLVGSFAQAEGDAPSPLKEMLDQTGLTWTPVEQAIDSWKVPFEGSENLGTIDVFLTYSDEYRKYALVFATVVDKPEYFDFDKDVLVECMKLNNDYTGAKFCLDLDYGDIDCQTEVLMSTLTAESLKLYLELVAGLADTQGARLREMAP